MGLCRRSRGEEVDVDTLGSTLPEQVHPGRSQCCLKVSEGLARYPTKCSVPAAHMTKENSQSDQREDWYLHLSVLIQMLIPGDQTDLCQAGQSANFENTSFVCSLADRC